MKLNFNDTFKYWALSLLLLWCFVPILFYITLIQPPLNHYHQKISLLIKAEKAIHEIKQIEDQMTKLTKTLNKTTIETQYDQSNKDKALTLLKEIKSALQSSMVKTRTIKKTNGNNQIQFAIQCSGDYQKLIHMMQLLQFTHRPLTIKHAFLKKNNFSIMIAG